jgi:hypothetical protein
MVSRDQERKEIDQYLKHMEEKVKPLLKPSHALSERSTAGKKWELARKFASQAPELEAWGGESRSVNGAYSYVQSEGQAMGPPFYQQYNDPNKWIYVALTGEWWLGEYEDAKDREVPKEGSEIGLIRSADCVSPGALPHQVEKWDVCRNVPGDFAGEWKAQPSLRLWLADQVALHWQKLRLECCEHPVIRFQGAKEEIWNGLYDFVASEGSPGTPPIFQHQQCRKLWLYLATDQRWWISSTIDMDARADRGQICSCRVQPGTHPCDASSIHQFVSNKEQEMTVERKREPEGRRAVDQWAEARRQADAVQVWGKQSKYGEYEFVQTRDGPADPPSYRSKRHADIWLYAANDGAWWMGTSKDADERKPRGFMRSDVVQPGTLPTEVQSWTEQSQNQWKVNESIAVISPQEAGESWTTLQEAVREESPVLELQGVPNVRRLNGLFDYMEDVGDSDEAPIFNHQIFQDIWLYVATDGCWWVGNTNNMEKRIPKGKLYSEPITPGTHPRDAVGWQVYDADSQGFSPAASVSFS